MKARNTGRVILIGPMRSCFPYLEVSRHDHDTIQEYTLFNLNLGRTQARHRASRYLLLSKNRLKRLYLQCRKVYWLYMLYIFTIFSSCRSNHPTMLRLRPLRRTRQMRATQSGIKNKRNQEKENIPSSSLDLTAAQCLPIFFSYAESTDVNMGSESGCVDAKARSKTYRSTALSSVNEDW
jgi:hypothetical protein